MFLFLFCSYYIFFPYATTKVATKMIFSHFLRVQQRVIPVLCMVFWGLSALCYPLKAQASVWQNGTHDYVYRVFLGGFEVGEVSSTYTFTDQSYDVNMMLEGKGFLQNLLNVEGKVQAKGQWQETEILPTLFRSETIWRGNTTSAEINFTQGELPYFRYTPEDKGFKSEEYPPQILLGTIDPISLSVFISRHMSQQGNCNVKTTLFSGRNLIAFEMVDKGNKPLPENDVLTTTEQARYCLASIVKIRSDEDPKKNNPDDNKPIMIDVYLSLPAPQQLSHPLLINATHSKINGKIWLSDYNFTLMQ